MKHKFMWVVASLAVFTVGTAATGDFAATDDSLGLSQTSVFDVETPAAFEYRDLDPKVAGILPRAWEDAPPQIPHRAERYLPVNAQLNKCLECHEEPDKIGNKEKGKPTPMSDTHYVMDGKDLLVSNKHYVCTLCHAPQTDVDALVGNTFKGDR